MRVVMSFVGETVGLTKPYKYQVVELDSLNRAQLWYREPGGGWHMGHGKDVPSGSTIENVANLMRLFIQGELTHETYNQLLPH